VGKEETTVERCNLELSSSTAAVCSKQAIFFRSCNFEPTIHFIPTLGQYPERKRLYDYTFMLLFTAFSCSTSQSGKSFNYIALQTA